jgi:hypothetical protein
MTVVIHLAPFLRPRQHESAVPTEQAAQILFYTGVRYERAREADPVEAPAPRRRRSPAIKLAGAKRARQPA